MEERIRALRMQRQCLTEAVTQQDYIDLFRGMSPVRPEYWGMPGDPPFLAHRAGFADKAYCFDLRAERKILKGRFQKGTIGYVAEEDFQLYGAIYRKNPSILSGQEAELLELLRREGPMNIKLMKEFTGILSKYITPVLHKLQEKFLVFEDQTDSEGDRAWYLLESEFPEVDFENCSRQDALKEVLLRFTYLQVWINLEMMRCFYELPVKDLRQRISELEAEGRLTAVASGWILTADKPVLTQECRPVPHTVFVLHRNDFLVKSNEYWLKNRYQQEPSVVLQYILIDGMFQGGVMGKFKNGPYQIEDILLDLDPEAAERRRDEILQAVYRVNDPRYSPVKRYMGKAIV